MIVKDNSSNRRKVDRLLGPALKLSWKKLRIVGSPGIYLKSFVSKEDIDEAVEMDTKFNMEKRPNGILLRSNKGVLIPVLADEMMHINVEKGEETIRPLLFSPFALLLKLNVPLRYAHYFRLRGDFYSIEDTQVEIKTKHYSFQFAACGFLYEDFISFLSPVLLSPSK